MIQSSILGGTSQVYKLYIVCRKERFGVGGIQLELFKFEKMTKWPK
jgi:hypothetical protein